MALIRFKRTTRSALDSNASAGNLSLGEPYIVTDESPKILAVGTSTNTYQDIGPVSAAAVVSDDTLTGDGTSGDALGVDISQPFSWGGVHEFISQQLRLASSGWVGLFATSLSSNVQWDMPDHTGDIPVAVDAGDTESQAAVRYNGTTRVAGRFYGGTTDPIHTVRLNLSANLHVTSLFSHGLVNYGRFIPFDGVLTPPTLTGNVNNYNPSGLADASVLRIDPGATARDITGLAGGVDGRVIIIENIGTNTLNIPSQSGSSTAANRFSRYAGLTQLFGQGKSGDYASVAFRYSGDSSRWVYMGQNT